MKIIYFTVYQLTNGAHAAYIEALLKRAKTVSAIVANAQRQLQALEAAYAKEDEVLLRHRKSLLTDEIQSLDADRDRIYLLIFSEIKRMRFFSDATISNAAKTLYTVVKAYGKIESYKYDRATGMYTNLVQDLAGRYADFVETLGLTQKVGLLGQTNNRFADKIAERTDEMAHHLDGEMADARQKTDSAYETFVMIVNALSALTINSETGENPYADFIMYINAEIKRLKRNELRQRGRSDTAADGEPDEEWPDEGESEDGKPDDGEESDDKKVKLTFEKEDETTITLTGLPGESYEIPVLPDGKIWISAENGLLVPSGIFPAVDATFIEVALGERKSVVFHFLSGEHETFTGLPGTEYVVPDTDEEDCEWRPVPTGVIPDVDTQYFETRISAEEEERPKYRITFRADGRVVATQEYHEGETIVPPECPEGFEWPDDLPEVMPARNLVIVGVEID